MSVDDFQRLSSLEARGAIFPEGKNIGSHGEVLQLFLYRSLVSLQASGIKMRNEANSEWTGEETEKANFIKGNK